MDGFLPCTQVRPSDLASLIETGFVEHRAEAHQAAGMVAAQLTTALSRSVRR